MKTKLLVLMLASLWGYAFNANAQDDLYFSKTKSQQTEATSEKVAKGKAKGKTLKVKKVKGELFSRDDASVVEEEQDANSSLETSSSLKSSMQSERSDSYLRPSISFVYITDGSQNALSALGQFSVGEKYVDEYDYNPIGKNVYTLSYIPNNDSSGDNAIESYVGKLIEREHLANAVMHVWFPEFSDGAYVLDTLISRGAYAATDNDVLRSDASARSTVLNELGEQLVDRSHILFIYIVDNVEYNNNPKNWLDGGKVKPHRVIVKALLYKLDFNDSIRMDFYSNYFSDPDGIDSFQFPVDLVSFIDYDGATMNVNSESEVMEELLDKVSRKNKLQVQVIVHDTKPIRTKSGRKEGIKADRRYGVMENRLTSKGRISTKRIATVRANRVVDNRKISVGSTKDYTTFYQVSGKKIQPGMSLVKNRDMGVSIGFDRSEVLCGFILEGRPALLSGGGAQNLIYAKVCWPTGGGEISEDDLAFCAGWEREFHFARLFVLTPFVGVGMIQDQRKEGNHVYYSSRPSSYDDDNDEKNKSYLVEGGIKLGLNISRTIQYYVMVSGVHYFDKYHEDFDRYYKNIGFGGGIKFSF